MPNRFLFKFRVIYSLTLFSAVLNISLQMSADVDYFPHIRMKDTILTASYDRRNSWTPSLSSSSPASTRKVPTMGSSTTASSSSSSTAGTPSWLERKLFSHFKRFFQRKSSSSSSNTSTSPPSSRRTSSPVEEIASLSIDEQPEEEHSLEEPIISTPPKEVSPSPPVIVSQPVDLLYDYERLLARCLQRHEQDRSALLQRCQTPISIPHAKLVLHPTRSTLINWKSYVRLFRTLTRHPTLFQQYLNEHYRCQSQISSREHLILPVRTTQATVDHLLRKFLDDYVTCLTCQTAQTHLIKFDGKCRIECQLCGSQRTAKRLRWKHH